MSKTQKPTHFRAPKVYASVLLCCSLFLVKFVGYTNSSDTSSIGTAHTTTSHANNYTTTTIPDMQDVSDIHKSLEYLESLDLTSLPGDCKWSIEHPSFADITILCHQHLMILYNVKRRYPFASYATYNAKEMKELQGGRRDFMVDPLIAEDAQHSPTDTVWHTPYSRGHLTPSNIMSYDKSIDGPWYETYYITNVLPQLAKLNEDAWEKFEANITDLLGQYPDTTSWEIYTGGYWNNVLNLSAPPDFFWKAFCDRHECSSAVIMATHEDTPNWSIEPVNKRLTGLFHDCCPLTVGNIWHQFFKTNLQNNDVSSSTFTSTSSSTSTSTTTKLAESANEANINMLRNKNVRLFSDDDTDVDDIFEYIIT